MNQKNQVFKINGDSRNRKSEVVGGEDWCGKKKSVKIRFVIAGS